MDVKIGFSESPRELVISAGEEPDQVADRVANALKSGDGILELTDAKGHRYLVRTEQISYVEIGAGTPRSVGFVGA